MSKPKQRRGAPQPPNRNAFERQSKYPTIEVKTTGKVRIEIDRKTSIYVDPARDIAEQVEEFKKSLTRKNGPKLRTR